MDPLQHLSIGGYAAFLAILTYGYDNPAVQRLPPRFLTEALLFIMRSSDDSTPQAH